ncbi:PAS domain-containing sensor histidine kinase [Halodesulfurarchaeum formicicum]|uniref:histidine kinase n=1 Tax=Halodesulfurarchaeum formicicum TaxID=1873524 RepID=A0A1D8S4X6_9EURY|nr:PAS domain-containing sensor histidine kinase [Halodesulfurarchaeum formicicum]AOW80402.1 PAS domain-containing sensor histidine kinase [Halodesulfurarchaeum formicicum]
MDNTQSGTDELFERTTQGDVYRELFEALPDPVLVFDPETGRIVECNAQATTLFGYSRAELRGTSIATLSSDLGAHSRDRATDVFKRATDGQPITLRRQATAGDGSVFWAAITLQATDIGGEEYVLGTVRDTGETVKEEADIRAFKTAVENAGHSIYWTDTDGTIQYANPAFEEITGYDRTEAVGRNPRMLQSGEMSDSYYEELWETILAGETFQREVVNESAEGERFVVSQTIAPIEGPAGDIERFVAVNSDITERKRHEEKLEAEKEHVEQLHQRLSVMNRILRHDIRSSVNIIKGNAELARSSTQKLESALETVIDESDRLRRIAESVRHIESAIDDHGSEKNVIDVATRVKTKVMGFKNEYPDTTISVSVPDSVTASARERFDLALDHVLSNAVKHNDRDSPTVEVTVTDPPESETVEITVADDGPGIPDAEIDPLEAGRETPLAHSSGLGLWLTQWIVTVSDGTISFEENDPRGTIVRIELPSA